MNEPVSSRGKATANQDGPGSGVGSATEVKHRSLEGMHGTVEVPPHEAGFWAQWRAYVGPALLVSVGYMDPGNWGTDLAAGAQFKYGLLWVVALASLMAIFLQVTAARLGVVTGKDLAQCCRDWYPEWTRWPNWLLCEVAIGACDLAEVLGSAVALNLMFHIPLLWAVLITATDVLLLLALQRFGIRTVEALVLLLVATIGVCYFIEIFRPSADRSQLPGNGSCAHHSRPSPGGHGLCGDRHHWRDGYAAQPLPALGAGAKPQAQRKTNAPSARRPLQYPRLDHCAVDRVFRQCRNHGAGGDGVLRERERDRRRRPGGQLSETTPIGFAWHTSRLRRSWARPRAAFCSPSGCWPVARAAPSPGRLPGR